MLAVRLIGITTPGIVFLCLGKYISDTDYYERSGRVYNSVSWNNRELLLAGHEDIRCELSVTAVNQKSEFIRIPEHK